MTDDKASSARSIGFAKERLAEEYLKRHHLRLVARNHQCRHGEIDLVMRDGETLVFVEVRFRRSTRHGTPAETVGSRKQRRLAAAAAHYLQHHPSTQPCRFDVVAITDQDVIQWVKHAFTLDS